MNEKWSTWRKDTAMRLEYEENSMDFWKESRQCEVEIKLPPSKAESFSNMGAVES